MCGIAGRFNYDPCQPVDPDVLAAMTDAVSRALARRVPPSILERGKQGFAAPIGEWLRGPLAAMASDLLLDGRLRNRGIFNPHEITRLWTEHQSRRADHRHRLWQLVMLELWFRQFIDGAPAWTPSRRAVSVPAPSRLVGATGH